MLTRACRSALLLLCLSSAFLNISVAQKQESGTSPAKKTHHAENTTGRDGNASSSESGQASEKKKSNTSNRLWFTHPAFLTAIAGLLAAVGGIIAAVRRSSSK